MSAALIVLCFAAFAMVAAPISVLLGAVLPKLDGLFSRLQPRLRVRLWLALAVLPAVVALFAIAVSFLPALGVGQDHCLAHGAHHPHLCPNHVGGAPGIVVVVFAGLVALQTFYTFVEYLRGHRLTRRTSSALAQACQRQDGVCVFASDELQAFVLGGLRPRIHVSRGLMALGPEVVAPVLAHERVHARHRDLLWRALCPVLGLGHFPSTRRALCRRLAAAQELAADAAAADTLPGGRLHVAEALVTLARLSATPSPGISFTEGDLKSRVHALLEDPRPRSVLWERLLILGALVLAVLVVVSHDAIHHGLETLLGALS